MAASIRFSKRYGAPPAALRAPHVSAKSWSRRAALPLPRAGPISRQEHETWDVLLACQGQLRLAPSGHRGSR